MNLSGLGLGLLTDCHDHNAIIMMTMIDSGELTIEKPQDRADDS